MKRHPRARIFKIKNCDEIQEIKILIFKKKVHLRTHTIKHLFSDVEWQAWNTFHIDDEFSLERMQAKRAELTGKLQCVYFSRMTPYQDNPPCADYCEHLPDEFDPDIPDENCDLYVSRWDEYFVDLIARVIDEALRYPLYAYRCKFDKEKNAMTHFLDFLYPQEQSVRIRAIGFTDGNNIHTMPEEYNVTTAHFNAYGIYPVHRQLRRALPDRLVFCSSEHWSV